MIFKPQLIVSTLIFLIRVIKNDFETPTHQNQTNQQNHTKSQFRHFPQS